MASFEFIWWWAFLLLPLPWLIYFFTPAIQSRAAIKLPYLPDTSGIQPRSWLPRILAIGLWILLLSAAARPVWYGEPVSTSTSHRDLMLVVDLSYSMSQEDMQSGQQMVDRLTAVKQVLSEFIAKREGDRIGLILFADHAYLQTPLTLDRETVTQQLNQVVLKLIGTQTAIGEGIGLATKIFIDSDAPQRVMILLSDGSNTAGILDPLEAANIAKQYHSTIYTVGVGAGEMVVKDFLFNRKVNTAQDLDEKTLQTIASTTGGQYFRARNQQDLQGIYDTINQLEPISHSDQTWRPQTEWFFYPLSVALLLSVILVIVRR
ncbi:vWA domain-containing protein [Vibrio metoecus]|uniref:vWA domain-containing protein n=1 Tax=Vibrio metoecus TaxID=1481663 RepID=UPI0012AE2C81|nr:VWA domain-containing protein [Vibrio metoecus]